ncbi:MAG TPA: L-threonylcarbamoyladenylate synthase [Candidatus Babeliales bacterium]|nr:L-threonylcarbamoyladenylate synthase [Candidatus Babeliales bacterium]
MKSIDKKYLHWFQEGTLDKLRQELSASAAVVTSTDTVLGLLAPISQQGYLALNQIKQRSEKPYLILIGSKDKIAHFVDMPLAGDVQRLIDSCWPGPLTLLFKARPDAPDYVKGLQGTIALRLPQHAGLLSLLALYDGLFSTSANSAGGAVPTNAAGLEQSIVGAVPYVVTDISDDKGDQPSTILDCTGPMIRLVRQGAYPVSMLEQKYGITIFR